MALSYVYLYPVADSTSSGTWIMGGESPASYYMNIDENWNDPDDAVAYIGGSQVGVDPAKFAFDLTIPPEMISISQVDIVRRVRSEVAGDNVQTDAVIVGWGMSEAFVGETDTWTTRTRSLLVHPTRGDAFRRDDLLSEIECQTKDTDHPVESERGDFTQAYVKVHCVLAPTYLSASRAVPARRLWWTRQSPRRIEYEVPLALALRLVPGDFVPVSDWLTPHESANGWGVTSTERRPCVLESVTLNPENDTARVVMLDIRPYLCLWRDTAKCERDVTGLWGMSRFDLGCGRSYTRNSTVYVELPWVNGYSVRPIDVIAEDTEAFRGADIGTSPTRETAELLIEGASSNECPHSSFYAGTSNTFTGWVFSGDGAVTEETDADKIQWEADTGIARCPVITSTSVIANDCQLLGTYTSAFTSGTVVSLRVDAHQFTTGGTPAWFLQRGVDSQYWDETLRVWSTAKEWNALGNNVSTIAKGIDTGTSATTLRAGLGFEAGTSGGSALHPWHVQIEPQAWPSSRIVVNSTTSVARVAAQLLVENMSSARSVNSSQGCLYAHVTPEWDTSDIGATNKTVYWLQYSTGESRWIYYDGTNDRFVHEVSNASVAYRATSTVALTNGTTYKIAGRWFESTVADPLWVVDFNPDDLDATLGTGDPVASWTPTGTLSVTAVQTTTSRQPTFNSGGGPNGHDFVSFSTSAAQALAFNASFTGSLMPLSGTAYGLAVLRVTAAIDTDPRYLISNAAASAPNSVYFSYNSATTVFSSAFVAKDGGGSKTASATTTEDLRNRWMVVAWKWDATDCRIDADNTGTWSDSLDFVTGRADNSTAVSISRVPTFPFQGDLARLIFMGTATSDTFDTLLQQIGTEYGLYSYSVPLPGDAVQTLSIHVDGVKGTDVVAVAPTASTSCSLEIGSKNTAEHWDGRMCQLHSFVHIPTDIEIARGLY